MDTPLEIKAVGYDSDGKEFTAKGGFSSQTEAREWINSNKHLFPSHDRGE